MKHFSLLSGVLSLIIVSFSACNKEANQVKNTQAKRDNNLAVTYIDTLQLPSKTIYISAIDSATYAAVPETKFQKLETGKIPGGDAPIPANDTHIQRAGKLLTFTANNKNKIVFTNVEGSYEDPAHVIEYNGFTYETDLQEMGYWLVTRVTNDYGDWILVSKQTADTTIIKSGTAISTTGKYLISTTCGGEGAPCDDAVLYLYKNTGSDIKKLGTLSLMPGKGWMPEAIKWIDDKTFVAMVALEDSDNKPCKPIPAYIKGELK